MLMSSTVVCVYVVYIYIRNICFNADYCTIYTAAEPREECESIHLRGPARSGGSLGRRAGAECREDLREREERIERLDARVTKLSEHIKRKDDILRRQVNIDSVGYIHVLYLVFH